MPCFNPLQAYQLMNGSVVFSERGDVYRALSLPCGNCVGCRLEKSRQWAVRCMHEASRHENNCFITLTYDNEHCPPDMSLKYRDYQLFMKRLRRKYGKVRFYMCGEYGEDFSRPHYHGLLFGIAFTDLQLIGKSPSGSKLFRSKELDSLWGKGFCSVGDVTFESCSYVSRYIMKKINGKLAFEHYKVVNAETGEIYWRLPEFTKMSLKPGIGALWLDKYLSDVYPHDNVVMNGVKSKPPRYYDKYFSKRFPQEFEAIQYDREVKGRINYKDCTSERLAVRKQCVDARLSRLKRSI
jgi:hypothetical protein